MNTPSRLHRSSAAWCIRTVLLSTVATIVMGSVPLPIRASEASPLPDGDACRSSMESLELTAPSDPRLATVLTISFDTGCSFRTAGPAVLWRDQLQIGMSGVVLSTSAGSPEAQVEPFASDAVSTKRAVSQSLDPIGIVMTQQLLLVRYWWNGQQITNVYAELSESHHVEANGGGWYVDSFSLARTAGCVGCGSIEYRGTVDWGYRGVFDPTGTLFHNRHVNTVTAFGTGQARCTFSITWRNSLPGWSRRFICTS